MNNTIQQNTNLYDPKDRITFGVKQDLELWRKDIQSLNLNSQLIKLRELTFSHGASLFIFDWAIILLGYYISIKYSILIPFILLIVGSRQRGLSNLIHDSSHWNLSKNKKINDLFADLFGGLPLISPIKSYRTSHLLHHRHLGHSQLDPDSRMHQRYNYNDLNPVHTKWYQNVGYLIFNLESWKDSNIGSWAEITKIQKIKSLTWWLTLLIISSFLFSIYSTILFICFWQLSRATGYHIVRTFAEFLDHSGLPVGSIAQNSRIVTSPNWFLKNLFHPHNDNFHALHHFDPTLPNYNLEQAHMLIKHKSPTYNELKKNSGYFNGKNAAVKDFVGVK